MPSESRQVDDIFDEAIRLQPGQGRDEYLNLACGDDAMLRKRVERLLRAADESGSFLESPAAEPSSTFLRPIAERPGDTIGPYKLLQQIGEGGMGVVYMADQTQPINRRVALKIIRPGMDSQQVIARFEAERQALAMMDHPNISKVFDAGVTDTGRPYFVMELVKGVPITEYCDAHRLTLRQRLELFVPVCQALQHAHQKGIIHRDIKPSNVLVADYDDRAVPKVIDFGVAKAIQHRLSDKTLFTEFGQVLGTIEYMSPEQAKLNQWEVDTRSDIYSLGVLLYELLSGEIPFSRDELCKSAFDEILRIIREDEPPRPSTRASTSESVATIAANRHTEPQKLTALVRGELDWIVMKALEKDRSRRYDTASKFAEDVEHYLAGDAVEACPPSASYRLQKFVHRNKPAIATAAVVAVALLAGTVVSVWQAGVARRAASAAELARAEAQHRLDEVQQANELLGAIFAKLDLAEMSDDERRRPLEEILTERLASTLADLEDASFSDPLILASMQHRLAASFQMVHQYDRSVALAEKALAAQRELLGADHAETFATMEVLGWGYYNTRQPRLAAEMFEELLDLQTAKLGPAHLNTCGTRHGLAHFYRNTQGNGEKEIETYEQLIEVAEPVHGPTHDTVVVARRMLARAYYIHREDLQRGITLLEESLQALDEDDAHIARQYMFELAELHRWGGRPEEALPLIEKSLKMSERLYGTEDRHTLHSAAALACTYRDLGRIDEAIEMFEPAFEALKSYYGSESPQLAHDMNALAETYEAAGKLDLALPLYEEAFHRYATFYGKENPNLIRFATNLSRAYVAADRCDDALALDAQIDGMFLGDSFSWLARASALIRRREFTAYDKLCARMAEKFAATENPTAAEETCKLCLLRPDVIEPDRLPRRVLLASLGDEATPRDALPWNYSSCALLALREGDADDAIDYAREAMARKNDIANFQRPEAVAALNNCIIALAANHLGQAEVAQEALNEASRLLDVLRDKGRSGSIDFLTTSVLHQEAESKIGVGKE